MVVGFTGDNVPGRDPINPPAARVQYITVVSRPQRHERQAARPGHPGPLPPLPPPPAPAEGEPAPTPGDRRHALNGQQEIVILGVTAPQAEVIKFAQMDGTITLVLRSAADFPTRADEPDRPAARPRPRASRSRS